MFQLFHQAGCRENHSSIKILHETISMKAGFAWLPLSASSVPLRLIESRFSEVGWAGGLLSAHADSALICESVGKQKTLAHLT
jgi:hypothetical protein